MERAHEETGHGHTDRRTPQSPVKIGEAAGRGPAVTSRQAHAPSVADALPPRTHFDSQQWLSSRQPSKKGTWVRRGGAVLVTGLLGALGWVGYQQMTTATAKAESASEEELLLEGQAAATPEAKFAFHQQEASESIDASSTIDSPFDSPQAFSRSAAPTPTASPSADASAAHNPFAAFAPQTAMAPVESPIAEVPPQINPSPARRDLEVTPAANEAPAVSTVEIFEVTGQSEPASSPGAASNPLVPAPAADPFAAFAPQAGPGAESASTVPAPLGGQQQAAQITADAEWAAQPPVTPVQFTHEPQFTAASPPFEPQARPIEASAGFASEPAPDLSQAPATIEFPSFEQQPAAIEPRASARRLTPQVDSPSAEPARATSFDIPQPAAPANDPRDEKLHVVQQGETYWSISRQHYGAGRYFQALADYNKPRISDQASLKPGMKVLVPSAATLDARYGRAMQASGLAKPPAKPRSGLRVDPQGRLLYVVGEGDTLGEIARRYLGKTSRSDELSRLNQEQLPNPDKLKAGMILVMPDDAAEVQSASSIPGRR